MDNQKTPKDIYYDLCDKYIETMDRGDIVEMAMIEYAEQQVKLFAIPDVSNQRELLIAFFDWLNKQGNITNMYTDKYMYIEMYLKSN